MKNPKLKNPKIGILERERERERERETCVHGEDSVDS